MKKIDHLQRPLLFFLCIIIACLGRVVPHPANITPLASLSILAGIRFPRWLGVLMVLITMLVSDMLVSLVYGYSPVGPWMWFTYSGFVAIVFVSPYLCRRFTVSNLLSTSLLSSFFYWAWTNLGTWMVGSMYPKDGAGLMTCYIAGLPFLRSAIMGNLVWMLVIVGLLNVALPGALKSKAL